MMRLAILLSMVMTAHAFAQPVCPAPKLVSPDGTCCWGGQIGEAGQCTGTPECPAGMQVAGGDCIGAAMPLAKPLANPEEQLRMDRARFSGKRLAVEILVGEASGLLTSYLLCNDSNCPGDGWLAFGADFAVTPLVVWGVGNAMGGQGSLMYSYLGASPALTPFSIAGSPDESPADTLNRIRIEATVSALILPACSALLYEVSSQVVSMKWRNEHAPMLTLRPIYGHDGMTGGIGSLSLRF